MSTVVKKERLGIALTPAEQSDVTEAMRTAYEADEAVYSRGGCTANQLWQ